MQDVNPARPDAIPFRNFVIKIHGRCDLACDYCYMYRSVDQVWRTQPRAMSASVIESTARRIGEHVRTHGIPAIGIVLHGGEPLLAGAEFIRHAVRSIRQEVESGVQITHAIQTNGVRLDEEYLALFAELGVRVGVSMDGDRTAHDRHRRRGDGRGSHTQVAAAVDRLVEGPHRSLFSGLLCTIDLRNDPVRTYRALLRHRPPMIDFLLPHGNWHTPPPGRRPGTTDTPYADWLIQVFEEWYGAPAQETRVRVLEEIVTLLLGGRATVEGLSLEPLRYVVIETDGSISQDDTLRTTYPGAAATALHVLRDPFDRALHQPALVARRSGAAALGPLCRGCRLRGVCGGGHYAHRYRADGSGFTNPSVYCPDLTALIQHMRRRVGADIDRLRQGPAPCEAGTP